MATSESDVTLCFSGVRLEQLCQEGGKCIDKGRSHYCVCPEGRTGSHCEHEVVPARPSLASTGALAVVTWGAMCVR